MQPLMLGIQMEILHFTIQKPHNNKQIFNILY